MARANVWIYYVGYHILHMVVMIFLFLQIFLGLRQILGKQIPVGVDNMTWTLLKPMMSDSNDVEAITENYSKLNVALGVIHECFEPVKEPHTQRDLVEDVIFNRG
jgi:hypothetical protein